MRKIAPNISGACLPEEATGMVPLTSRLESVNHEGWLCVRPATKPLKQSNTPPHLPLPLPQRHTQHRPAQHETFRVTWYIWLTPLTCPVDAAVLAVSPTPYGGGAGRDALSGSYWAGPLSRFAVTRRSVASLSPSLASTSMFATCWRGVWGIERHARGIERIHVSRNKGDDSKKVVLNLIKSW